MNRVLVGFIGDGESGGIDTYLMSFMQIAALSNLQLDFLTSCYTDSLAAKLKDKGFRLYEIPSLKKPCAQRRAILDLQAENHYDAAYLNISTAVMYPAVKAVYDAGIPEIMVHAHAAGVDEPRMFKRRILVLVNAFFRKSLSRITTKGFASSCQAAQWVFGSSVPGDGATIIPNPVDLAECGYDEKRRMRMREELAVGSRVVLGSITALKDVKNPFFLIDLFHEYYQKNQCSVLIVVGEGELRNKVEKYAAHKLPEDAVLFLGKRNDVPDLLQAFDVFVLPSKKEGLSIAALEAQTAGLPCIVSDGIPKEAIVVRSNCYQLSLSEGSSSWARLIESVVNRERNEERRSYVFELKEAGYTQDSPSRVVNTLMK